MKNTFAAVILKEFLQPRFRYKGMPVNLLGFPVLDNKKFNRVKLSKQIYRLKQKEFIKKEGHFLHVTLKGKEYVKRKQESLSLFESKNFKSEKKDLIVMFDIPESKKAEREWFRFHLKKFGYLMIQRSVWVGPSPLPGDFLDYLKEIKLKICVKTFKLAKSYKDKD
ncbi:MAG: hypothetical protein UR25_C0001G0008 [Candidatus Nomurabacteria bacterium GW2011_GWE1_32_28]|uniref:Transcriptional repressor PaaX-like central Cas2-like domain-containing protein n=1 Tax=Candidatus Nomurabacteria bacterium GW2011_GWF1_31_48 TaxID=1618767 RepID=A0A0G0BFX9_9BACT|nr:MAG: hypothetical protein UR10_C0005G0040 [Candidatus Nomurabacteria bacterium GW2011_GWF2_30_133]KKP28392.1 MAG: hypothetical protein UR18_C0005G0040 [Candidatus Nomurabacteria bacterium GW2011_GWE2_31_40]KKP29977.1 MAG: hypothetical protein UR19_C0006G0040 [Candidatus Nomurabacteria bacterium GW2011_GWF1_31_48]KKP35096.1 MAG: hypothetical protein UR25_C0001G0008 [Candidatus Nomurabacteria bacterium GW2011_GWE1_32_28]HAS80908.1 CRISPR-associated endonuclease Cas2 [Candidatus Nomurabacteria 